MVGCIRTHFDVYCLKKKTDQYDVLYLSYLQNYCISLICAYSLEMYILQLCNDVRFRKYSLILLVLLMDILVFYVSFV